MQFAPSRGDMKRRYPLTTTIAARAAIELLGVVSSTCLTDYPDQGLCHLLGVCIVRVARGEQDDRMPPAGKPRRARRLAENPLCAIAPDGIAKALSCNKGDLSCIEVACW